MKNLIARIEKAAEKLYLYESDYVQEREEAIEEWNSLIPEMRKAGIDWKDYLPHRNCAGEKLW